jgi:hypothetical protein
LVVIETILLGEGKQISDLLFLLERAQQLPGT